MRVLHKLVLGGLLLSIVFFRGFCYWDGAIELSNIAVPPDASGCEIEALSSAPASRGTFFVSNDNIWIPDFNYWTLPWRDVYRFRGLHHLDAVTESHQNGALFFMSALGCQTSTVHQLTHISGFEELAHVEFSIDHALDLGTKIFLEGHACGDETLYWVGFFDGAKITKIGIPETHAIFDVKLVGETVYISDVSGISVLPRSFELADVIHPPQRFDVALGLSIVATEHSLFVAQIPDQSFWYSANMEIIRVDLTTKSIHRFHTSRGQIERLLAYKDDLFWINVGTNCIVTLKQHGEVEARNILCEPNEINNLVIHQGYLYWVSRATAVLRRQRLSCISDNLQP